jgi:tRNA-intron endonuclease
MSKKNKQAGTDMQPASEEEWNDEKPQVVWEQPKEVIDCKLEGDKVICFEKFDQVYEPGFYGKQLGDRLELALVEAALLLKRGRIKILKDNNPLSFQEIYDYAISLDARFSHRFRVYEDLRERGLVVRTGFKFGCDFRVYERGVQLKKGPKSAKEHTKWIVFAVPEDFTMSFQELSRSVRLAHNIRARMLWALVDNEGDCTYYMVTRHKP